MPFIGLAEGYLLAAFRQAKVSMQRIRPAIDVLAEELGLPHALASENLYTDGAEVLYDYAEGMGDTPEGESAMELVMVRTTSEYLLKSWRCICSGLTSGRTATQG